MNKGNFEKQFPLLGDLLMAHILGAGVAFFWIPIALLLNGFHLNVLLFALIAAAHALLEIVGFGIKKRGLQSALIILKCLLLAGIFLLVMAVFLYPSWLGEMMEYQEQLGGWLLFAISLILVSVFWQIKLVNTDRIINYLLAQIRNKGSKSQ